MNLTAEQSEQLALSRHRFHEQAPSSARLKWPTLVRLYADPTLRFADIARTLGLSRERARQLYQQYFVMVWPEHSGPVRQQAVLDARRNRTRRIRPKNDLAPIVAEAERRGYAWARELTPLGRPRVRALTINGKHCWLCTTKTPWLGTYIRLPIGIHNHTTSDVLLFVAEIPGLRRRVFVVPGDWVRQQPRGRFIVLRMQPYGKRGPRPGTHVAEFIQRWEEAWDRVLGPPQEQLVA